MRAISLLTASYWNCYGDWGNYSRAYLLILRTRLSECRFSTEKERLWTWSYQWKAPCPLAKRGHSRPHMGSGKYRMVDFMMAGQERPFPGSVYGPYKPLPLLDFHQTSFTSDNCRRPYRAKTARTYQVQIQNEHWAIHLRMESVMIKETCQQKTTCIWSLSAWPPLRLALIWSREFSFLVCWHWLVIVFIEIKSYIWTVCFWGPGWYAWLGNALIHFDGPPAWKAKTRGKIVPSADFLVLLHFCADTLHRLRCQHHTEYCMSSDKKM